TLHIVVPGNAAQARQLAQPPNGAGEQRHFEDASDQNAPGGGVGGVRKKSRERERRHHRKVEQDGRGGRRREAVERVEQGAEKRDERQREERRKGDARERDREREAAGIALEAGGKNADHRRRERDRNGKKHDLGDEQQRENAVGEHPRRVRPALGTDARIGRHEGGAESALGKDGAEVIGEAKGHEESVSDRTG